MSDSPSTPSIENIDTDRALLAGSGDVNDSLDGWVRVGSTTELRRARTMVIDHPDPNRADTADNEVSGIAAFWNGGEPRAMANRCIHMDRALARGTIFMNKVVCPGHQWAFRFDDGVCAERERTQPIYAVRVVDGVVYLDPRTPSNVELLDS